MPFVANIIRTQRACVPASVVVHLQQSMLYPAFTYPATKPWYIRAVSELWAFGVKNALSCLFPVWIFAMLGISPYVHIPLVSRYDFLLLACLFMQAFMFVTKMESREEVLVIGLFHLIGLGMELFKVNVAGSWAYPEEAFTKIGVVPLYSGFMYASVASFMCQAWRRFDLKVTRWPNGKLALLLGILIYANFFTNYYVQDIRYFLIPCVFLLFLFSGISFTTSGPRRKLPLVLAFVLIGLFVWFAENIATYLGAWTYPHQSTGWQPVHYHKLTSWSLMVIVSFIIVVQLNFVKREKSQCGRKQKAPVKSSHQG